MKKTIKWEKPRIGTVDCGRSSNAGHSISVRSAHYDIGPAPTPVPPSRPDARQSIGPAPSPLSRPDARQSIGPAPNPYYHLGPAPFKTL